MTEPIKPTPDEIVASVADDPDVLAALRRWDPATPSSYRDLVHARLVAQERAGIPEAERAPIYSGEVVSALMAPIMRMGRGDEAAVLAYLRRNCQVKYGEHAERVLRFMLQTYPHDGASKLLELAIAKGVA